MKKIRVLVADDHSLYRKGVSLLLESIPHLEMVGEAGTGREATELALSLKPDVILMDIQMPDGNGIQATEAILQELPDTAILMVTMLDEDSAVFSAMRLGAMGYILKGVDQGEMTRAIEMVADGHALFSPSIAKRMREYFKALQTQPEQSDFPNLTTREWEVLDLIVQGMDNGEIAKKMVISRATVRNYINSIFSKLQVKNRAQALLYVQKHHINTKPHGF